MSKKSDNKKKSVGAGDRSEMEQNAETGSSPLKLYVLPSEYRLAADGHAMEMPRRIGTVDPEKLNNKTAVVIGGRREFSVWGLFADGLRLLQNDSEKQEYTVECLDKNGSVLPDAVEIEYPADNPALRGSALRRGVSFSVSGRALNSGRKTLEVSVCAVSKVNPRIKAAAVITVVRPLRLAFIGDDFCVSENGRSLSDKREQTLERNGEALAVGVEDLPEAYVLPSNGESLFLQPIVLCSDGMYRQVNRSEIELEIKSNNEAELEESNLRLLVKKSAPGIVEVAARLLALPDVKTAFSVEIVVPKQIFVSQIKPEMRGSEDPESGSSKKTPKNKKCHNSGTAEDPLTLGVGEELRLDISGLYSDGLTRPLNLENCLFRVEASEDGGNWTECDALRITYRKILAMRHLEDRQIRLTVTPKGTEAAAGEEISAVLYLKTLKPVALYLAPSHYLHLWRRGLWSRIDTKAKSLNRLCQERTVGVSGWCALDFIARYSDGSVRFVDMESLEKPQRTAAAASGRRKNQETDDCVKFRMHRRLIMDGVRLTKQPLEYQVRLSGTEVASTFKVSVSKVKALHLVQSGLMRRVLFDDKGQPVNVNGERLENDEILDRQAVELLPGQAMGVMVLAEYEDGCWGYCRRQTYELRHTAGVDLLDRGFILITPKKQTPEFARVKAASVSDRKISAEFFVDVKMPDRLCVYIDDGKAGGDSGTAYREASPDEIVDMRIGDVLPFSVLAVYGNMLVSLRPSDYNVSTLGAGVCVWSGRSYRNNADRERLEAVFEEEMELDSLESEGSGEEDPLQNLNSGVRFEAVKRTRENKTVEVTVRLRLKPSVKGSLNIRVQAKN